MLEALNKPGFSFVEVIAPCSTLYARRNRLGTGLDLLKFYHDNSEIKHGADPTELDIGYQDKIKVGKFLDIDRPTFIDGWNNGMERTFGSDFEHYGGKNSKHAA